MPCRPHSQGISSTRLVPGAAAPASTHGRPAPHANLPPSPGRCGTNARSTKRRAAVYAPWLTSVMGLQVPTMAACHTQWSTTATGTPTKLGAASTRPSRRDTPRSAVLRATSVPRQSRPPQPLHHRVPGAAAPACQRRRAPAPSRPRSGPPRPSSSPCPPTKHLAAAHAARRRAGHLPRQCKAQIEPSKPRSGPHGRAGAPADVALAVALPAQPPRPPNLPKMSGAAAPAPVLRRQQPAVQGVAPLQPETPAHEGGGPAAAGYQTGFARWLRLAATRGADGGGRRLGG